MDAATKARLDNPQKQLEDRGVVDVKFDADYSQGAEKVGNDMADVLEAVLDGKSHPALPIGDSVRGQSDQ